MYLPCIAAGTAATLLALAWQVPPAALAACVVGVGALGCFAAVDLQLVQATHRAALRAVLAHKVAKAHQVGFGDLV